MNKIMKALSKAAWGYLFLHLNINLFMVNLLPEWAGYVFLYQAVVLLEEEEASIHLLRPFALMLAVWEGFSSLMSILGFAFPFTVISLIMTVTALYFHFQLITNLAGIALKYTAQHAKSLLRIRTARTLIFTFISLPLIQRLPQAVFIILLLFYVLLGFWIIGILVSLRKHLIKAELQ